MPNAFEGEAGEFLVLADGVLADGVLADDVLVDDVLMDGEGRHGRRPDVGYGNAASDRPASVRPDRRHAAGSRRGPNARRDGRSPGPGGDSSVRIGIIAIAAVPGSCIGGLNPMRLGLGSATPALDRGSEALATGR
ncbi:MAG TPA: hypothetical protein VFU36_16490, partial [Jatrophihabitans sp.]|nr:hypothetical protein [Jatrophihabitans sp.]